jgi:prepilin-type N-terminal cleavage/methylation domain-containing protein
MEMKLPASAVLRFARVHMNFYHSKLNKRQRVFTLIELLITLTIALLITGMLPTVIFQIFVINTENSSVCRP